VINVPVTKRNFNRVKFGTKTTLEAMFASGWAQTSTPTELLMEKNGVTVKAPPSGHCGIEWTWDGKVYALTPEAPAGTN